MKTETFKKYIKNKFGSMSKFALLVKIDRYEIQKLIAAQEKNPNNEREKQLSEWYQLARKTANKPAGNELTEELRVRLKLTIDALGGVGKFVEDNPEFNATSLFHILNGTRKTINAKVKWLLKILNIEISEDGK